MTLISFLTFSFQAKRAMQRGATAIIFDTSDNPDAVEEVDMSLITHYKSKVIVGGVLTCGTSKLLIF